MFEGLMQPMHLLLLVVIALIIFGPSKLADLGKSLGEGIKNFKTAVKDPEHTTTTSTSTTTAPTSPVPPSSTTTIITPGEEKK